MVTTGKLGIVETLDRTNGQWLWHKEAVPQNVVAAINPKTGEKTINVAAIPHIGQTTVNCPADPGGRGWPATASSPKTGTLCTPLNEYCSNTTPSPLRCRWSIIGAHQRTIWPVPKRRPISPLTLDRWEGSRVSVPSSREQQPHRSRFVEPQPPRQAVARNTGHLARASCLARIRQSSERRATAQRASTSLLPIPEACQP